jgi:hypothetical protein
MPILGSFYFYMHNIKKNRDFICKFKNNILHLQYL